jgi:hypothetical protein
MYVDGRVPASRDMTKGVLSTSDSPLHVPRGDAGASNKRAISADFCTVPAEKKFYQ